MPEIQIVKKEREKYGGTIISPSGADLLPKDTDIVEYTRAEKIKLGLLETGVTKNNPEFTGNMTLNGYPVSTNDLNGTNYVMVYGVGTPTENAAELQSAYDAAKTMPRYLGEVNELTVSNYYKGQTFYNIAGGEYDIMTSDQLNVTGIPTLIEAITEVEAKSVRTTVVVAPGIYKFDITFSISTQYVDIKSLTGTPDVIINSLFASADNIYIKGIHVTNVFVVGDDATNQIFENCKGDGDYSFSFRDGITSGVYINCKGGNFAFGGGSTFSGEAYDCVGGDHSYGTDTTISNINIRFSGKCVRCKGGDYSFGGMTELSGYLEDCIGGQYSFGGEGGLLDNVHLLRCKGGDFAFGSISSNALLEDCIGGQYSIAASGSIAGTLIRCTGGIGSFCRDGGDDTGAVYLYCRVTHGLFPTQGMASAISYCINGDNTPAPNV